VFISEVMLQQTQVPRVIVKYREFIRTFPGFKPLAEAPVPDVLAAWQGLGYNRRALALRNSAAVICDRYNGKLPTDPELLDQLPGIGPATAGSICAFAFNMPVVFIETNIRSVFIHNFFKDREQVSDKEIVPLVAEALDRSNPRNWYYALMDYGVYLKKKTTNPSRRSKHYSKQTLFEGSHRQKRAEVLRLVLTAKKISVSKLASELNLDADDAADLIRELSAEGFISIRENSVSVVKN